MTSNSTLRLKTAAPTRANFRSVNQVLLLVLFVGLCCGAGFSQTKWRAATEKELAALIPARAPVEKEQIETELRTAAGLTDGKGKFIAGVVIITAGYAADGKYSHFFITQTPLKVGELTLAPGQYVFGYRRVDGETLEIKFYEAATGNALGLVKAIRQPARGVIRSMQINAPKGGKGTMQLGRFVFEYSLSK